MKSRRADVKMIYQGKNITSDISADLLSVRYDEGFGQADTVEVQLQDRADKWLLKWRPKTGERMQLEIRVYDWARQGDRRKLSCGAFLADEIEYTAPPRVLCLRGNSLPSDGGFIGTPHSRTWKNVTLKDLITSMLPKGYALHWQSTVNVMLVYAEQDDTPDLEYISGLCEKYGLRLKVLNNRLAVFDAREMDAQKPVRVLGREDLAGYAFRHAVTRTQYDGCKVKHQSAGSGKDISFIYPAGGSPRKLLEVTETVYSPAEAEIVAKAALWNANLGADGCDLTLAMGDPALLAGRNIQIKGFGDFDGVYAIDASSHELGSGGYQTSLTLHKVIVEQKPEQGDEIAIGDVVNFAGGSHYVASTAATPTGGTRTAGTARVTNQAMSAPHPYHLIGISSNVYGWVDAEAVSKGGK